MNSYLNILDHVNSLTIIDTHEHLPLEQDRPKDTDVLSEWLIQYFSCDLISAGMSEEELEFVKDPKQDILSRWKIAEPYWHAAENTGYGRSLSISARDLYGIENINGKTIKKLNKLFQNARENGNHYKYVLKEKSKIGISIKDSLPLPYTPTDDPFVFTLRVEQFIYPSHYKEMRKIGKQFDMEIHSLNDWMECARKYIEKYFQEIERVVCLKCGLAYQRSLRFDKVRFAEAETAFNELFKDENLPDWRPSVKPAKALADYMMHFVCKVADDNKLVFQFHTGLLEGNGNFISDANPTHLTNLFLEYSNVKFDIFHMGYPYVMELSSLAKNFRNVFIDMCWGHIISPEAAKRALTEWLDSVPANKISAFGGDYCFVDGVYGHQFLARENVAKALTQKVNERSISINRAKEIAEWIFMENPKRLFNLEKFVS